MIYSYAELKGRLKVGDKVRAVPGKFNQCGQLYDDGSNAQEITGVHDEGFCINNCFHSYHESVSLDLVEDTSPPEPTMRYKVGDILTHLGCKYKVLGVCGLVYLLSEQDRFSVMGSTTLYTQEELDRHSYTLLSDTISIEGKEYDKAEALKRLEGLEK